MRTQILSTGAFLLGSVCMLTLPAHAQVRVGQLHCSIAGGFGIIVTSARAVSCAYDRRDGATDFYMGSTGRIGLDLGPTNALSVTYQVLSPTMLRPGALGGTFTGVGVGATVGSGIGADALVGGKTGAIYLTPAGNSSLTGINVNAGIATLHLRYVGSEPRARYVDPIYR